ncbi:hypothetical protein Tco_1214720 [Tanacetum coccineum]
MYTVQRSGRLYNKRTRNQENDQVEVIDLTTPEWDDAGEAEFLNDEPNEHVHGAQETSEKDMDVDFDANNAADINDTLDEIAGVQVDKMENHKAARKALNHGSNGQGVVRKGKLAAIVKKTKKEEAEKAGKRVAVNRKKAVLCEKGYRKKDVVENGKMSDNKEIDELDASIDDDFVTNVGARHGPRMVEEKGKGRKKIDDDTMRSVKGFKGKGKSTDDDCANVKRAKQRQKQDVRGIGFGAFLEFKIKDVPKRLAYWLLEKFNVDTCSLNVNGRSIMITPEVVRNLLGVLMSEVHINARNETYFRNPLACQWKAQFGKDLKRQYNTHVGNEIVEKRSSGWMFKINFLVLFFSTVGELNFNNTVNLKFIHCINSEDDILKLDWCTYIIECSIKTKRSWKRSGFYNVLIVLLLIFSSDMLNKLEADVYPTDDGGDTDVGEEAKLEGNDEEQVLEEDDVEEDY